MPASAPSAEPEQVDPPYQAPAETKSPVTLEVHGFIAAQVTLDSNNAVAQNHLISVGGDGEAGRIGFAFDATRVGAVARTAAGDYQFEGRAEADLQNAVFFRVRHAYASARKGGAGLLIGLTDTLVGNVVGPNVFNNDWFFAQGNAFDRLPQVRVSFQNETVSLAVAALQNLHGAPDVLPHLQARASLKAGPVALGLAGHAGITNRAANPADATQTVDGVTSLLISADAGIPLGPVVLSAQVWAGQGAAHGTGGHAIGNPLFVVDADGNPVSVPSVGGFLDALFKASDTISVGLAAGTSTLTNAAPGGVAVPIANNSTATLYASASLRPNWTLAAEVQAARTLRAVDVAVPDQRENQDDLRLLLGQKIAF